MANVRYLGVGAFRLAVPEPLVVASESLCAFAPFEATDPRPVLQVTRGALESGVPLDPLRREPGRYAFHAGGEVRVDIPLEPRPCVAALRFAYAAAVLSQGGLLVHGACVSWNGQAVVALGESGAGKSTLARLCVRHAEAGLLSDETVGLLPSGEVIGTPLRSDADLAGSVPTARLRGLLALRKGSEERLEPMQAPEMVQLLLKQTYRLEGPEFTGGELLRRATRLVSLVPAVRLTFRKHLDVGLFLRRWVSTQP